MKQDPSKSFFNCESKENLLHTLLYSIKEFSFLSEKRLEKSLQEKHIKLTLAQIVVLISVSMNTREERPLNQCSIAEFLHVTEATISRHIKSLITEGYLAKNERKEGVGRGSDIVITKKGFAELGTSTNLINTHVTKLLSPLTEKEQETLRTLLKKLIKPLV